MKKFIAKLILGVIIGTILSSINFVTFAKDKEATSPIEEVSSEDKRRDGSVLDALIDISNKKCFNEEEAYIVTIIEEPLLWDKEIDAKNSEDFKTKICYRNTVMYKYGGSQKIISQYATECSQKLQELHNGKEITYSCEEVMVLLSKGGTTLIEGYISVIYRWGASLAGIVAVLVMVVSGIQISASGGDSQAIESAKSRIIKSLAGLAVLFLSALILYTINPTFFTAG